MTNAPTTGNDAEQFIRELFAAVDAGDTERVVGSVTDGVRFRFGSAEPLTGRAALAAASQQFSASIAGLHHEITDLWQPEPGTVVAELRVTYHRHDGSELTLPCCNIFRLSSDGLVEDYRIYMDVNPVFA
jgi:ketosteroid isomerase-like protein